MGKKNRRWGNRRGTHHISRPLTPVVRVLIRKISALLMRPDGAGAPLSGPAREGRTGAALGPARPCHRPPTRRAQQGHQTPSSSVATLPGFSPGRAAKRNPRDPSTRARARTPNTQADVRSEMDRLVARHRAAGAAAFSAQRWEAAASEFGLAAKYAQARNEREVAATMLSNRSAALCRCAAVGLLGCWRCCCSAPCGLSWLSSGSSELSRGAGPTAAGPLGRPRLNRTAGTAGGFAGGRIRPAALQIWQRPATSRPCQPAGALPKPTPAAAAAPSLPPARPPAGRCSCAPAPRR
jgi:hypothetical protein